MEDHYNIELDTLTVADSITCDVDKIQRHLSSVSGLKVISQNIRSISCNLNSFYTSLCRSGIDWDVIILSECWLKGSGTIPSLQNYSVSATERNNTQNEGVVVYFKKQLNLIIEEPLLEDANCLLAKLSEDTCIIGIYRPPSHTNTTNFINSLDLLLQKIASYKNILIFGDLNIDISTSSGDNRRFEYLNLLACHGLLPAHTSPTRGNSCLDHVMIKTRLHPCCYIIESSVTDHECVALNINLHPSSFKYDKKIIIKLDYDSLHNEINKINLDLLYRLNDVNLASRFLVDTLHQAIVNNSKPTVVSRRKHTNKPWVTPGLLRCMRNRDNLYKKTKKDPTNEVLLCTYKRYRNFCNAILKKRKRGFEKSLIQKAGKDKKQLWGVIKEVTFLNNKRDLSKNLISPSNPIESINNINKYFVNIGRELADQIINSRTSTHSYFNSTQTLNLNNKSLVFLPTDATEVKSLILSLKDNSATGHDNIPGWLIKHHVDLLAPPIAHICNLSISTGKFPDIFKISLIKPVHKAGDSCTINNFRPISILPALSKILERLMNKQLVSFLNSNNIISPQQFGFRSGKSTNDAVFELTNNIVRELDNKKKTLGIFLDLKKAFDTVSIPLLLNKLERSGVRGITLSLLTDYLTNRSQQVKIGDWLSETQTISYGIPQGSIIGPTLFLLYINDLCNLKLTQGQIFVFADDTALLFSADTWNSAFDHAQRGLNKVCSWLNANLLTLNADKTKYIAFSNKNKTSPFLLNKLVAHTNVLSCNASCSCPNIDRVDEIKYLGVIIDETLTFKSHIHTIANRLRNLTYIFKSIRHIGDRATLKTVYFALCHSVISYCIVSWGGAARTNLIELERAQRGILKVAAFLPYRFPTTDLYNIWDILTVRQTFVLQIILKKHIELPYVPHLNADKRRKGTVCSVETFSSKLARKHFCFLGGFLYNKINSLLAIYSYTSGKCKSSVTKWIRYFDYELTEKLIVPPL